jgi:hypothetical protein
MASGLSGSSVRMLAALLPRKLAVTGNESEVLVAADVIADGPGRREMYAVSRPQRVIDHGWNAVPD